MSEKVIRQFFEVCHCNTEFTQTKIDEYLPEIHQKLLSFPTLKQLCINGLNQWNEQIKSTSSLLDKNTIDNLLQGIYDEEVIEELDLDNKNIDLINSSQINIPTSIINSSEKSFENMPNKSLDLPNNNDRLSTLDADLSRNIYQALRRLLIKPNPTIQPVTNKSLKKLNTAKTVSNQQSIPNQINTNHIPSFRQITQEEQQSEQSQKSKQVLIFLLFSFILSVTSTYMSLNKTK